MSTHPPDDAQRRNAEALYRDSLVVDGAVPVLMQDPAEWRRYQRGGVTAILATVTTTDDSPATIERIARFTQLIRRHPDELLLIERASDIEKAKSHGKLGIAFHFQNGRPLGRSTTMVELYKRLGVGVIQLCYNYRNNIGDGCLEPVDAGLSRFGRDVVTALNEQRVVLDMSHTGVRTSLEAMERSVRPDVFTHANARGVHDHPRNLTDEQIRAAADKGGVVGLCSFPAFITDTTNRPTVDHVVAHLDYIVELVGIEHVSLGTDYFHDAGYQLNVDLGDWDPGEYPAPPWHYPLDGGNTVEIAVAMMRRGYSDDDVRAVLGGNLVRVLGEVWGA
jgi:membrane dipeptidase